MEDDADAGDVGDDTAVEEIGREELLHAPLLSAEEVVLTNVANGGPGMTYGASGSVYAYEIRQSPIRSRSQRKVKMPPIMTHIEEDSGVSRVVRPWKADNAVRRRDLRSVPQYTELGAGGEELSAAGRHCVLQAYQLDMLRQQFESNSYGKEQLTSFRIRYAPGASPSGIVTL